jgi:hypothetical protein
MKRIIAMIVCLMMVFSTCALAERGGMGGPGGGMGGPGGGMGGGMTQNDEEIQAILDANASKFQQFTFTDEETSNSLEYSLFIPEDYDASKSYPLIMFIPDSTGAGKSAAEIVEQYYGATVWVTDEEQAKHAEDFYCIGCMAEFLGCEAEDLQVKIAEFKEQGCTLFL